jgi:Zn-dependent peptidase ImmA (M78 family)
MELEEAAHRLGVKEEKLAAWEAGSQQPTVRQLRKAAAVYQQCFAAFYLPDPPEVFEPPVHDYRRVHDGIEETLSSELVSELRLATDRRAICLELLEAEGQKPPMFDATADLDADPEELGLRVRKELDISMEKQRSWRDFRVAFNSWREAIEGRGVLVFQARKVPVEQMRGCSVAEFPLPCVLVNRKDAYVARTFSMIHETVHLMLHCSGLCDMETPADGHFAEPKIEMFCNHVAGAALVPREELLAHPIIQSGKTPFWGDSELRELAITYGVSREAVLRRLLILGRTTRAFYQRMRSLYVAEHATRKRPKGHVPPAIDVASAAGRRFSRTVLEAFYSGRITASDFSEYIGMKLRHMEQFSMAVGMG